MYPSIIPYCKNLVKRQLGSFITLKIRGKRSLLRTLPLTLLYVKIYRSFVPHKNYTSNFRLRLGFLLLPFLLNEALICLKLGRLPYARCQTSFRAKT